ncbi:LamG domain-containing protein [Aliikangiella sp. G2MR2-5]|uniref:LamG domain-containing protein n=1 Tax=Aliikangiella sp. G2MR2-5 TaxID=2788943 RepID=UPI0018A97EB4|nr:LamG domain-containing protein [Aliikangiella sp. G2MR2-5]
MRLMEKITILPASYKVAIRAGLLSASAVLISACSGGGAEVEDNPLVIDEPSSNYSGPPPATDDVQAFKLNVWDNLSAQNRCGECHGNGQSPEFVHLGDVNIAYAEANTIVDLDRPSESRMVTKVAGGHNCWLSSDSACADTITSYITAWAGGASGASTQIEFTAPPIRDPGATRSFPESPALFATTVYPLLDQYCSGCHDESSPNPISPFFANGDRNTNPNEGIDSAYAAAKARIDLDTAANSRFVQRLRSEFHNCWSDCESNANEMQAAIDAFSSQIPLTEIDPNLLISKSLFLTDGIVASGGGRFDSHVIAMWNFKTGLGNTAFDTSGVEPAINLNLQGQYNWVGGWGIQIIDGKAQGSTSSSKKLHDLIKSTGEYSIEAWVAPANVTQEGPAVIVGYSASTSERNFTLGQTMYNYEFLNRSSETDGNGEPSLSTADNDEIVQTALQHVVATFSPTEGRKLYVNGELVAEEQVESGGNLNDWNDTYAFVLGQEASNSRLWQGTYRMVAIHNRALSMEQVTQNFDVGVGEKFFMLFSISHLIDMEESYVVFEVSQWDSYGYLFDKPFFLNLNDQSIPDNIDMEKIRIAVNGKEVKNGQAYKNLSLVLNSSEYTPKLGQAISRLGTIIALEKGTTSDEFFLTFEKINGAENPFVEPPPPSPSTPVDLPARPEFGVRDFYEIHATLSKITGISMAQTDVAQTYERVKQQLPTLTDIDFFSSAHQMGITQLAIEYCNVLIEDTSARASYFPGFDFGLPASQAFDTQAERNLLLDPLILNAVGTNLSVQPTDADIRTELNTLIDNLTACGGSCAADRTETVSKAVCAAATGNAAVLVQ